jgi:MFS family permease
MSKNKPVKILALAAFLNDLGSDMIYPIWPFFVTTVINAPMSILGFIDGLGDAIFSMSQAVSGYISDKIRKRKIFVWLGYLFGSFSRIGYASSKTWQHLILFKVFDRAGKIRSSPRDAIIADASTKKNRGRNFGLLRAADNLGAVCGIIACLLLFGFLGYKNLFLVASIPSLIGVILILLLIKEKKPKKRIYKGFSFKNLNKNFKLFLFLSSLFALASFSYSFLLIYAKEFGFQTSFIPILYLIFTAFASLSSLPFGKISDKFGRKFTLILAYSLWGFVCLTLIFLPNFLTIILAFVLYGLHKGALDPVQRAFVAELAHQKYRASILGIFQMVIGLCALPSSLIAGLLWEKISIFMPFYFSLFLTILSIIMLKFVKEE